MEEKDLKKLIDLLNQVDPHKPLGTPLFDAIARLTIGVAIETVSLRHGTGGVEVYMTQRSLEESAYPGEWHCPGSFIRHGEKIDDVMRRLEKKETGISFSSAREIATINNPKEARGHIFQIVHLCTIEGQGKGKWFPLDQLPKNTVQQHREVIIPAALKVFEA
jgi:ADP-ribose pyrophosphatase YjhB (NUDIX family)